ncbi:hypothetical protein [Nitrosomonas ureae]|uniref:hypothetical protein n=1 Tax=Nitrosomonas ureae TaxID=44577 RepID=UPI0011B0A039|nr:hypothetical protein [Nitrosomonas ureae]
MKERNSTFHQNEIFQTRAVAKPVRPDHECIDSPGEDGMICPAEIETAKMNLLLYVSIMFIQNRSALTSIANTYASSAF